MGSSALPLPATPLFTAVGTEAQRGEGPAHGPSSSPCRAGLASRAGVTGAHAGLTLCSHRPEIPDRFRGTVPLVPIITQPVLSLGTSSWGGSWAFLSLEDSCPFQNTMPSDCMPGSA